mmetsp:Transcript_22564/g.28817  ORF Transcript_22564/g.28817 Transcript_22564/m.28817 type:complete len:241 (-) Transcript_22564:55-777(-)
MYWTNLHKWVVRYSDDAEPNLEVFNRMVAVDSLTGLTNSGSNLFHLAAIGEQPAVAEILLPCVPHYLINQPNHNGDTPFHWACVSGNTKIVSLYLKAGAEINCRNSEGDTPLHCAARAGHTAVIKKLFKQRSKPLKINLKNKILHCPLRLACQERNTKTIRYLISQGARYQGILQQAVRDQDKYTVKRIVQAIQKHPQNPHLHEYNPLPLAVKLNHKNIIKILAQVEAWQQPNDTNESIV